MLLKNRFMRILAVVLAAGLALLLIIWAVAGPVAKPQVVKWLESQGAETATIQSLIFNPFRPSLQIKALTVNAGQGQPLYLERAYVRLSWLGLLHKEIRVRRVEIQNLKLKVIQTAEAITIGGLSPLKPVAEDAPDLSGQGESQPLDWHLRLDDLVVSSSLVDVSLPDFSGAIDLDQVHFQNGLIGETVALGALGFKGQINSAPLQFDTQVDIQKGKGAIKGKLALDQLALAPFQPLIADAVSHLQGQVSLDTQWQIEIDGAAISLDQGLTVQLADLNLETPEMILGQKQGQFQTEIVARVKEQKVEMAHIKRIAVNDARLVVTMKKKPPQKESSPKEQLQTDQSAPPATADGAIERTAHQTPAISILIDEVAVGGDTRVDFTDRNLDPAFSEQIRNLNFKITELDNQQFDKPSPFTFSAEIQKYGKLNFSGTLKPFGQDLYADLKGRISEYGLPPVSGYTHSMLGYNIKTGQLNADVALKIENRLLNGQTQFDLKALKLIPSAKSTSDKLTKQATMPLDLALGYISDDKGNLLLKMPIEGSLDDPQFGISHLCQIVMVKAAKSAAYGYLKNMLLPYGALVRIGVSAAVKAGQNMMALKLAPLVYPPGQVLAGPESKEYVDQLVALMTKEPNMRLIICGVATKADMPTAPAVKISAPEKEKRLLDLARQRMELFKQMLIETRGIQSSRLLECYPRIDESTEGSPRIEIDL